MRKNGKKRDGQRNVLPPQIFNEETFRGDFADFDIANEDDNLEEFLGLPRKGPKIEFFKTGAIAANVGKLDPGKLELKEHEVKKKDYKMFFADNCLIFRRRQMSPQFCFQRLNQQI